MKHLLCISVLSITIVSCGVKLPSNTFDKQLKESNYVDNKKENYTLYIDPQMPITQIKLQAKPTSWNPNNIMKDHTIQLPNQEQRPYFDLITPTDTVVVANRHIDFKKVINFRDIGGIKTKDGKTVQWGKIFRSDNLSKLQDKEFDKFENLNIRSVIDLRTKTEIKGHEDHLPSTAQYFSYPSIEDDGDMFTKMRNKVINGKITEDESLQLMMKLYQSIVSDNVTSLRAVIHKTIESDTPVLYHCSAGKDRTGIITALIFSILNVDRETIKNEYLLSNHFLKSKTEKILRKIKIAKVIKPRLNQHVILNFMRVDERYLNAAFEVIDTKYGGIDSYIKNELQIDDTMRKEAIRKLTY